MIKRGIEMTSENFEIECPGCGEFIDINEQIAHKLKEESLDLEKRVERELTERMNKSHLEEISNWKAKLEEKERSILQQNDSAEENRIKLQEMQHLLNTQEQQVKIASEKAALEARQEEAEKFKELAEESAKQKTAVIEQKYAALEIKNNELQDQMRQQKEMHQEALRKAEQGSVQTQGEGGEIYIEDLLRQAFPGDDIEEVAKGQKGADVIQKVRFGSALVAGVIVWEGKRAQNWSNGWISKIKEDTVRVNGHISVIVSDVSKGAKSTKMDMIEENVWVCSYTEILGLATSIRSGLIRAANAIKSQEGKGTKMELLYEYMSGQEFINAMRMVNDSYVAELEIVGKERRAMEKHWRSREKAATARLEGFSDFMGTIKTIATELPAIKEIENDDQKFLPELDD
jgi:hypothetical protein